MAGEDQAQDLTARTEETPAILNIQMMNSVMRKNKEG